MPLDRLSLATVPITPYFNQSSMPGATGFIWKRHERFYLITNWHVASATHLFTGHLLLKGGMRPNQFQCQFIVRIGNYERETIDIPVRDDDGSSGSGAGAVDRVRRPSGLPSIAVILLCCREPPLWAMGCPVEATHSPKSIHRRYR
jgi:hypothetical protein